MIKVIAFDCFGTVFDMSGVSRDQIRDYVRHVKKEDFTPYPFPAEWYNLKAHADSAEGIKRLQRMGMICATLSNGSADLLMHISKSNGIDWYLIIDLEKHRAYKPNNLDAYRAVEKETLFPPEETLLVTANPTFGDIESSAKIGMPSQVIRNPGTPQTIIELADQLMGKKQCEIRTKAETGGNVESNGYRHKAGMLSLSKVIEAIEMEEEFEGDIPQDIFEEASSSPEAMAEALRVACRLTKQGIRKRIEGMNQD